jgi:hypothetical protein
MMDNKPEPGLELDKLIAEKVLGWHQESMAGGARDWWFFKEDSNRHSGNAMHLNRFSTDIRAAWDLAEKLRLCVVPLGDGWTATKADQILMDSETNKALTAPHAICLAALLYTENDE